MSEALRVVGAVIHHDGRVLACRRRKEKSAGGKWEFPGGKIEPGESPEQALARELAEELGLEGVDVGRLVAREVTAGIGQRPIDLACYLVQSDSLPSGSNDHDAMEWRGTDELAGLDWAEPDLPTVERLTAQGIADVVEG